MCQTVISAERVDRCFGANRVLRNLSFSIEKGSVFGLVGHNGAGKTTLLRLILGLLKPDSGTLKVLDRDPWKHDASMYCRIGVVLEHHGFPDNFTPYQGMRFFAAAKGISTNALNSYLEQYWSGFSWFRSTLKIRQLSRGQKTQCAICRAFLGWPDLCLLDESLSSLDVASYDHFCSLVKEAKTRGCSLLLSSHQLILVEELCDTIGIIQDGSLSFIRRCPQYERLNRWMIAADNDKRFGQIICSVTGHPALWNEGAWHFIVDDPQIVIPAVVSSLAAAGCVIREVRKIEDQLAHAIRGMLTKK